MCIICEAGFDGDRFLAAFERSRIALREATEAMLICSKTATTPEARQRYDATHKRMVKLLHEWNALEEFRENHGP